MKKLSQINEGFLSKTLGRSNTDGKRLEERDIVDTYMDNVKWVDMEHKDYLFAEDTLELMGVSDSEFLNIKDRLKNKYDAFIIDKQSMRHLRGKCDISKHDDYVEFTVNNKSIIFGCGDLICDSSRFGAYGEYSIFEFDCEKWSDGYEYMTTTSFDKNKTDNWNNLIIKLIKWKD